MILSEDRKVEGRGERWIGGAVSGNSNTQDSREGGSTGLAAAAPGEAWCCREVCVELVGVLE